MDKKNALAHLHVGVPMAIQFAITAIGVMVMQAALNNFGSVAIAGFTAANKVETLVTQPFVAIGITMATYCGQNRGARKMDRIRQGFALRWQSVFVPQSLLLCSTFLAAVFSPSYLSPIKTIWKMRCIMPNSI